MAGEIDNNIVIQRLPVRAGTPATRGKSQMLKMRTLC